MYMHTCQHPDGQKLVRQLMLLATAAFVIQLTKEALFSKRLIALNYMKEVDDELSVQYFMPKANEKNLLFPLLLKKNYQDLRDVSSKQEV